MSKADLFKTATDKNALRRESGLPLLNIRAEMDKEANRLVAIGFAEASSNHAPAYAAIYEQIRGELFDEHGTDFHLSSGGQQAIRVRAATRFKDYLFGRGVRAPEEQTITYGSK